MSQNELVAAFLAGVEHVSGPEGCGAKEAEAAREYAERNDTLVVSATGAKVIDLMAALKESLAKHAAAIPSLPEKQSDT